MGDKRVPFKDRHITWHTSLAHEKLFKEWVTKTYGLKYDNKSLEDILNSKTEEE